MSLEIHIARRGQKSTKLTSEELAHDFVSYLVGIYGEDASMSCASDLLNFLSTFEVQDSIYGLPGEDGGIGQEGMGVQDSNEKPPFDFDKMCEKADEVGKALRRKESNETAP